MRRGVRVTVQQPRLVQENAMKSTPFAERHPLWFVAFLELAIVLTYLVAGTIAFLQGRDGLWLYSLANIAMTLIAAALLTRMRWWRTVGFRRAATAGDLKYYAVALIPAVVNLIPGIEFPGLLSLAGFLALALMIGFVEETFFRGLMLQPLLSKGVWSAAAITSILFSVTHLMNGLAGRDLFDLGAQVAYTLAIGFAFAAIVIRKGVIWPLVLAHALIDFVFFLHPAGSVISPEVAIVLTIVVTMVFIVYGLAMLLGAKQMGGDSVHPMALDSTV
jgi:hypothetical protein